MTVASRISKHVYPGNGVTRVWPYAFLLLEPAHLEGWVKYGEADPVLLERGYLLDETAGTVTFPLEETGKEPLSDKDRIILMRKVPFVQDTDLENQGEFFAETHELVYDKLVMMIQQLDEVQRRSVVGPVDQTDSNVAYQALIDAVDEVKRIRDDALALVDEATEAGKAVDMVLEYACGNIPIGAIGLFDDGNVEDGWILLESAGNEISASEWRTLVELRNPGGTSAVLPDLSAKERPEGCVFAIKGKHRTNVRGDMKNLSVVMHHLTEGSSYCVYDDSKTTLHIYLAPGPTGPAGPMGPTGPVGPAGPQGAQGPQGLQGPQGPQGERGPEGKQGQMGLTGAQGPRGFQGEVGPAGPMGPTGEMGPTGPTGPQGPQGERGPEGIQGPKGETGDTGPAGPEGAKGPTGDKGPSGDPAVGCAFGRFRIKEPGGMLVMEYFGNSGADRVYINGDGRLCVDSNA